MTELNKILVIQTAFLGDVILALPLVQTIKKHLAGSQIDFICVPANVSVLANQPSISNVLPYDKKGGDKIDKFIEVLSEIRENKYDVVISPHRSLRSALLTYYSEAETKIGFNRNALSFLLTHKVQYITEKHEIQRNLDLFRAIPGVNADESKISLRPELYPSAEDMKIVMEQLSGIDKAKFITIAPCSRWVTKQLPVHKTVAIINKFLDEGYSAALIGGGDDAVYCRRIRHSISNRNFIELCGKLSPLQSYAVIKRSKALVCSDSAAQHIGAAAGIPIVLVYGSTDSSFGFYPLTSKSKIVEISGLECRPCTDHGRNKCPLGHFKCMEEILPEDVFSAVEKLIGSS